MSNHSERRESYNGDVGIWYMQIHPGSDPGNFGPERMLEVVRRYRDVGMGGDGWKEGKNTRRIFREDVQTGDVVALAHGRRFIALVRVSGEYAKNRRAVDGHWFGVVRPVDMLCDDPVPYMLAYTRAFGRAASEGVPHRSTLCRPRKCDFIGWWVECLMPGEGLERLLPEFGNPKLVERGPAVSWFRDPGVVARALGNRRCECCGVRKTFARRSGGQYFEIHHLVPMSQQGSFSKSLDVDANVVCLCPSCHRMLHFGEGSVVRKALGSLYASRAIGLKRSGIADSLSRFMALVKSAAWAST